MSVVEEQEEEEEDVKMPRDTPKKMQPSEFSTRRRRRSRGATASFGVVHEGRWVRSM